MFQNVGGKLKLLAKIFFVIGIVASVGGFGYMLSLAIDNFNGGQDTAWLIYILLSIVTVVVGPVASWLSVLPLYAFGELVEKATKIDSKLNYVVSDINPDVILDDMDYKKCVRCGKEVSFVANQCSCGCKSFEI